MTAPGPSRSGPSVPDVAVLVARAEALCHDYRLESVRAWKQRTGGLAVGFTPVYVPREVLHAMGALPVGIVGAGDDLEIIRGDAYYQSYICHIPRSTVERGLNGSLDVLDALLFPALCDVMRNLSGMWTSLFPAKLVRFLEWPQDFDPSMGGRFWRAEIEELAHELEQRGARPLTAEALRGSIAVYNRHRRAVEGLYELRRSAPWKVPTSELYVVLRAGLVLPVEEHLELLADYRAAVEVAAGRQPLDQARVVLQGSFCEQPPLGLLRTLERSGCYIVDDDLNLAHRWFEGDVAAGEDPLGDLVQAFLTQSTDVAVKWSEGRPKGKDLCARVRRAKAGGVLFCAPSFCDPALLDQPMAVSAVEAAAIPWTAFKYAENGGQFQGIREQSGTFSDSIRLWGKE
jgi:benzoyl-CoA reductase subunit C